MNNTEKKNIIVIIFLFLSVISMILIYLSIHNNIQTFLPNEVYIPEAKIIDYSIHRIPEGNKSGYVDIDIAFDYKDTTITSVGHRLEFSKVMRVDDKGKLYTINTIGVWYNPSSGNVITDDSADSIALLLATVLNILLWIGIFKYTLRHWQSSEHRKPAY